VIGTPFYLMDRMDGRVFSDNTLPGMQPQERRAIYFAMAETMAKLHQVDWVGLGLADFGKPGNFFARQLARWSKQWSLSKTQPNPDIDTLIAWLNANLPHDDETALAHGDFKLGNLMFHPIEPRVIAVLDWELSTIGHPLADVAFSAVVWRLFPEEYGGIRGLDLDALGIPREEEYLAHYYHCVSRETPVAPFHYALALMRWAVIFEGISARARIGTAIADNATEVGALSVALARRGVEVIEAVSTT
jgi:aminoglycoside phosphotransferase (APT) family kinase protein